MLCNRFIKKENTRKYLKTITLKTSSKIYSIYEIRNRTVNRFKTVKYSCGFNF